MIHCTCLPCGSILFSLPVLLPPSSLSYHAPLCNDKIDTWYRKRLRLLLHFHLHGKTTSCIRAEGTSLSSRRTRQSTEKPIRRWKYSRFCNNTGAALRSILFSLRDRCAFMGQSIAGLFFFFNRRERERERFCIFTAFEFESIMYLLIAT